MAKVEFVESHNNLIPEYWRNDANRRYSKTLKHLAKLTKQRFKKNLSLATKKEMNSFDIEYRLEIIIRQKVES